MGKANPVGAETVRVSVPVSLASDIGQFKKVVASVLDRLGCPACCSGHDILFEMQRRFMFDDALRTSRAAFEPRATLAGVARNTVSASMSPKLGGNIDQVFAAIDRIVDLSAHPQCTSGDDLMLASRVNILVNPAGKLEEQALVIN
jgi:hypothetical protein